jgi:hypothetical protein
MFSLRRMYVLYLHFRRIGLFSQVLQSELARDLLRSFARDSPKLIL